MVVLRDLRSMFWGVTIDGGKRYTQTVERSFHISMAALESVPEGNNPSKHLSQVSVMINHDKAEFLLCTLNHKHLLQQTLDLNFTEGEEVTFFLNGQGVVHLTGYLLEDQMDESPEDYTLGTDEEEEESMEEMSDEYEESDETPELVNIKKKKKSSKQLELTPGLKRKATDNDTPKKKLKLEELDEDESDEEDDSEDDDWDQDEFADFIDDEVEEEESDEEEDEEDIVESKTPQGKNQSAKAQKKKMKDKQDKKDDEEQSNKTKATPQNSLVAGGDANASSKKKKKKKKKKNKEQEATAADQQQSPKPQQQSPKPQQQTPKQQQQQHQQQQKTPKKQVLAGGVLMEELKVGNGPDAKKGKMVHVYYVGRLNNGKEFDSCKSGKPFRFRLGKFEVIKGWEIGIEGMKVGGKRRLTVPPQQGYGSQKQGEIPPNSTLIFDVELKAVS